MFRTLFRSKWIAIPAVLAVMAGVAVEASSHALSRRAFRDLQSTVRPTEAFQEIEQLDADTRVLFREVSVRTRVSPKLAASLDANTRAHPSEITHRAAALAWLTRGEGIKAARHLQLAARLAPDDRAARERAEHGVNVALLFQARPVTRPAALVGLTLLLVLAVGRTARRHQKRRIRKYVENLRADVRMKVDGEVKRKPSIDPHTKAVTVDLFLRGRYGMACPQLRRHRPPLHVTFSNAEASRTVRLTPVRETGDAIRLHVRPDTLDLLRAAPGSWRMHVRMDERTLALAPLTVRSSADRRPLFDRAKGWFGA